MITKRNVPSAAPTRTTARPAAVAAAAAAAKAAKEQQAEDIKAGKVPAGMITNSTLLFQLFCIGRHTNITCFLVDVKLAV